MSDLPKIGTKEASALPYYVGESGIRHRVMVENPSHDFKSPLGRYLRTPSVLDPKKLMYRKVSDDPIDTNGEDATIIDCAVEDHKAHLAQNDAVATQAYSPINDDAVSSFSRLERGEPVGIF